MVIKWHYFRILWTKISRYGILPTFIFALYRFFPTLFKVVPLRNNDLRALDYEDILKDVYDYNGPKFELASVKKGDLRRMVWFVPNWTNVWGGGHFTIFRFAHRMQEVHGVEQVIYIYNNNYCYSDGSYLENDLRRAIPNCKIKVVVNWDEIPECDAALATTWQSAYFLNDFKKARSKFYFMQDYESLFYAGGSSAMQANHSYELGFTGITGGTWLRSLYESYGGKAQNYIFATDRSIFFPQGEPREKVRKIFFYGRPSTERRAFELGIASLAMIQKAYPDIEIQIAGLGGLAKPPFPCTLLGNLSLKDTGDLYRGVDIGIAFSGTNLSYLPVELMACGIPVVTNNGAQSEWYCKNEVNSLAVPPTPSAVFEATKRLIESRELRVKLAKAGLESTSKHTWEDEIDKIHSWIKSNC